MASSRPRKATSERHAASSDVDEFLRTLTHPLRAEICTVRELIMGSDPRVKEEIKWNAPSFYTVNHFATFHLRAKDGVQVVLHLGAKPRPDATVRTGLKDPAGLLVWKSADRATVTFRDAVHIQRDGNAFRLVVEQWLAHVRP
jgi:hypothetical protein